MGLGVWVAGATHVSDGMFLDAAMALASTVTDADLKTMSVFPELGRIRDCSCKVAKAVAERAVHSGYADEPMSSGLDRALVDSMWFPAYHPLHYERQVLTANRIDCRAQQTREWANRFGVAYSGSMR